MNQKELKELLTMDMLPVLKLWHPPKNKKQKKKKKKKAA